MPTLGAPIMLDATYGEGGGALLRTAVSMAALTQQPLKASGIRGGLKWPGLSPEDLTIIRAMAAISGAETVGAVVGSHELSFLPTRRPRSLEGKLEWLGEMDSGQSIGALVVLGTLAPVLARTGAYSSIYGQGETFGQGILTYDYFVNVTAQAFKKLGLYAFPDQLEAGFGRGSRGEVRLEIEPSALHGADLSHRGELIRARAIVTTSELPKSVSDRGRAHLEKLAKNANIDLDIEISTPTSRSTGAHITVLAEFENGIGGSTAMGQKGVRMEAVAQNAFDNFFEWYRSDATLDPYVADQIVLAASIAEGDTTFSVSKLTQRLLTIIWVIKQFTPIRITIKGHEGEPGIVLIRK